MLRLREVREARNLSQADLARLAGVAQCHISDLERGRRKPSFEVLVRLAKALECSLDDLVDLRAAS